MVALEMAGTLEACTTLPRTLDIRALRDVHMPGEPERDAMRSVATDATSRGRHHIVGAIEDGRRWYADTPNACSGGPSSVPSSQASYAGNLARTRRPTRQTP
jgi:hypothetical protein